MKEDPILSTLITELKRGNLTLCVLSQLKKPHYGYSLLQLLADKQIPIEANTLYPLLRRLEVQELLSSTWDTSEARPRKFYVLSDKGTALLSELCKAWQEHYQRVGALLAEEEHE